MGVDKTFISKRRAAFLLIIVLSLLYGSFVIWESRTADKAIHFQFVGLTNAPGMVPKALIKITNRTHNIISCPGYGYLGGGESVTLPFDIPPGKGPWRASLQWQCQDLSRFDEIMNEARDRFLVAFGVPHMHRDPWFPLEHISYSSEIQRAALKNLDNLGLLPGVSQEEHWNVTSDLVDSVVSNKALVMEYPASRTNRVVTNETSTNNYTYVKQTKDSKWKLQKIWLADSNGQTIKEWHIK